MHCGSRTRQQTMIFTTVSGHAFIPWKDISPLYERFHFFTELLKVCIIYSSGRGAPIITASTATVRSLHSTGRKLPFQLSMPAQCEDWSAYVERVLKSFAAASSWHTPGAVVVQISYHSPGTMQQSPFQLKSRFVARSMCTAAVMPVHS